MSVARMLWVVSMVSAALTACASPAGIVSDLPSAPVPAPAPSPKGPSHASLRAVLAAGGVVTVKTGAQGCWGLGAASYVIARSGDELVVTRNGLRYVLRGAHAQELLEGLDAPGAALASPLDATVDVELTLGGVSSVASYVGTGRGVMIAEALRTVAGL